KEDRPHQPYKPSMKKNIDYILLITVFALVFFGLAMIASVSVYESYNKFQQNDFYFWRRMVQIAIAVAAFIPCLIIPYRFWEKVSLLAIGFSLFLLMLL